MMALNTYGQYAWQQPQHFLCVGGKKNEKYIVPKVQTLEHFGPDKHVPSTPNSYNLHTLLQPKRSLMQLKQQ